MEIPQLLYESVYLTERKLCLVCGSKEAKSVLRTSSNEVCPLCEDCSFRWNFYRYSILKKIKIGQLLKRVLWYKLFHWNPSILTIWRDLTRFKDWSEHIKQFRHLM